MRKGLYSILAAISLMFLLTGCGNVTMDLNKYVSVEFSGGDTLGKAKMEFDSEKFYKDYEKKVKFKDKKKLEAAAMLGMTPIEVLEAFCIGGSLDETTGLSNGDTVTVQWECEDKLAKEAFGCTLKYSDMKFEVSGLKEIEDFDPFEYVEIVYSGVSPFMSAEIKVDKSREEMNQISVFFVDAFSNVRVAKGDVLKLQAQTDSAYFAEKFGKRLSVTEKEFVAEAESGYVTAEETIPKEWVTAYDAESEQVLRKRINEWTGYAPAGDDFISAKCVGYYLYDRESYMLEKEKNYLILIYQVDSIHPKTKKPFTHYMTTYIRGIITDYKGTFTASENVQDDAGMKIFSNNGGLYFGWETLEEVCDVIEKGWRSEKNKEIKVIF